MERRPHGQIISLAQPVNFRNGKAGTAFFQRRPSRRNGGADSFRPFHTLQGRPEGKKCRRKHRQSRRNGNKRLTEKKTARFTPYGYAPFARQ